MKYLVLLFVSALLVGVAALPATASEPLTYAVGGDSTTCEPYGWDSRQQDPEAYQRVGGFCANGYTSAQVLAMTQPAPQAHVGVIMVGTNDVRLGKSTASITANVVAIAQKLDTPRVIIAGIPPSNSTSYGAKKINRATQGVILNRALAVAAAEHGWLFVDPFMAERRLDGKWAPGTANADGVHPTAMTSAAVAVRLNQFMQIAVHGTAAARPPA